MGIKLRFLDFLGNVIDNAKTSTVVTDELIAQAYFRELALYIGISYIANTLSKCEAKVYEGNKEVHDELYYALNVHPNPNMSSAQFWNRIINDYFRKGEVVIVPVRDRLYIADGYTIEKRPLKDDLFKNICIENQTLRHPHPASDVLYFRLDHIPAKALIDGAANAYTELLAAAMKAYKRDKGRKYKLAMENTKAGDKGFNEEFEKVIKKQLMAFMEHDNAVYPEFKGYNLSDVSPNNSFHASATGEDIFGLRKEIFDITAQALKIPSVMMHGNITAIKDVMGVYLTICIDPLADMISKEITRKTNTFRTWKSGNYVRLDTSCIQHLDILDAAASAEKLVSSGTAMIDEVRARIGLPKYNDDFGRAHFITRNFQTAEAALAESPNTEKGGETQ